MKKRLAMAGAAPEISAAPADLELAAARAMLAKEYCIEAAFVGVPKLARVLGVAPSTIYGYMRRGEFFIPYRMLNTTPVVRLDDLARWYCASEDAASAGDSEQSKNCG